jgi:colicin import membrane protein
MNNELQTINPEEFGIDKNKANQLVGEMLPQVIKEREILIEQFNQIITADIEDPNTPKQARELRLLVQKNRTQGITAWHKTAKDYFLKGGQFVDAIKRKEVAINEKMESDLEAIEKYAEIKEQQRKEALRAERTTALQPYAEFVPFGIDLGAMSDEDFTKTLNGAKLQHKAKIEAEKQAEIEHQKEVERQNKIKENKERALPYKLFISDWDDINFETANVGEIIADAQTKKAEAEAEAERQRIENDRLKSEAEAARKEAEKLEAQRQSELKAEREKQKALEAELKAKKEAEAKAERERIEAENKARKEAEKLAKAPVKKQLHVWVDSFNIEKPTVENEATKEIQAKFESFKTWSKSQIEKI